MNQYGIQFEVKNKPSLDPECMPILKFNRAFLETAKKPVSIALERSGGQVAVCDTLDVYKRQAPARNCGKSGSLPRAGGDHPRRPHTPAA